MSRQEHDRFLRLLMLMCLVPAGLVVAIVALLLLPPHIPEGPGTLDPIFVPAFR